MMLACEYFVFRFVLLTLWKLICLPQVKLVTQTVKNLLAMQETQV